MSILVVGSVAFDSIETPFGKSGDILGGSATYFSVGARLFAPVNLVAVVGKDFSRENFNFLKNQRINLDGLSSEKGKTFRWRGKYGWDFSDPTTLATHLNVFGSFNPKIPKKYQTSDYVFLANIDPVIQKKVLDQVKKPKVIACDTMNFWIENKRKDLLKLLRKIDIFIINESEAKELTHEANLLKSGRKILKLGPKVAVIKRGEHGVLLFTAENIFVSPAFLLESVVDPTGAGDTFAGGFMGYLARSRKINQSSLRNAVVYGSIMATFAVESFGLQRLSRVKMKDINLRIKKFKKYTSF